MIFNTFHPAHVPGSQVWRAAIQLRTRRGFTEQAVQVQPPGRHCQLAISGAGPYLLRFIAIQLDSIVIGVA